MATKTAKKRKKVAKTAKNSRENQKMATKMAEIGKKVAKAEKSVWKPGNSSEIRRKWALLRIE